MDNELAPVESLSYEQARDELVQIVKQLESGQAPLETTLSQWERGEALAAHCKQILDVAASRLDKAEARVQ